MYHAFENMNNEQFERLVIALCQFLLGTSTTGFSTGSDGGKDGFFEGTAKEIPSSQNPWVGKVVIQVKHTQKINASCSDKEFFSDSNDHSVLGNELEKIKKLRGAGELDHYMLVTNRKLSALTHQKIRAYLSTYCGLPTESILLVGKENLEMWLRRFPDALEIADNSPLDFPLSVDPNELSEIIEALSEQISSLKEYVSEPVSRLSFEQKNLINGMTPEYAKEIRKRYLSYSLQIQAFLADPLNAEYVEKYSDVTQEFQLKIIAKRRNYQTFDEVMEYLVDLLFNRDPILRKYKVLTRALLFHMYWFCDIGQKNADISE